jgi:hypothetical protein
MTKMREQDDGRRTRKRRSDGQSEDTPAQRPDDEVPANRREDPQRRDKDDDQEHRERRGS